MSGFLDGLKKSTNNVTKNMPNISNISNAINQTQNAMKNASERKGKQTISIDKVINKEKNKENKEIAHQSNADEKDGCTVYITEDNAKKLIEAINKHHKILNDEYNTKIIEIGNNHKEGIAVIEKDYEDKLEKIKNNVCNVQKEKLKDELKDKIKKIEKEIAEAEKKREDDTKNKEKEKEKKEKDEGISWKKKLKIVKDLSIDCYIVESKMQVTQNKISEVKSKITGNNATKHSQKSKIIQVDVIKKQIYIRNNQRATEAADVRDIKNICIGDPPDETNQKGGHKRKLKNFGIISDRSGNDDICE